MPWTPADYEQELLYENHGSTKKPRYKLTGWVRVRKPSGETFLEPLPNAWYFRQIVFTAIEEVPQHTIKRGTDAGELSLTGGGIQRDFGGREA